MPNIGVPELLLFFLILLLLFGAGRLAGVGSAVGRTIRDFRREMKDVEHDVRGEERPSRESPRQSS